MSRHAYDIHAEQALLGAMLLNAGATDAFLLVPPQAYYLPKHADIAAIMRDLLARHRTVDPIMLLGAVEESGLLPRIGGAEYLHTLVASRWTVDSSPYYAERIVELYGRRRLAEECQRELQRLDSDWELGEAGRPLSAAIGNIRAACDELLCYSAVGGCEPSPSLETFLAEPDTWDWLVPGLLERGDRAVITGSEGFGKSELTSQIALCVAGGVHPFLAEMLDSTERRVLVIDCENGTAKHKRRLRRIMEAVNTIRAMHRAGPAQWDKCLFVEIRPAGLDLLKATDETWLGNKIAARGPDLLLLGPLYKQHTTNINDGEAARRILDVIDRLRERHGFALLTEAHAGHGKDGMGDRMMRPEGSSLFMRWPEFGLGLRRGKDDETSADVISWRGDREEGREWPKRLERGRLGQLPWRPDGEYFDRPDPQWGFRD